MFAIKAVVYIAVDIFYAINIEILNIILDVIGICFALKLREVF
jgi:hypothetical protein